MRRQVQKYRNVHKSKRLDKDFFLKNRYVCLGKNKIGKYKSERSDENRNTGKHRYVRLGKYRNIGKYITCTLTKQRNT